VLAQRLALQHVEKSWLRKISFVPTGQDNVLPGHDGEHPIPCDMLLSVLRRNTAPCLQVLQLVLETPTSLCGNAVLLLMLACPDITGEQCCSYTRDTRHEELILP